MGGGRKELEQAAREVAATLQTAGHEAYFAGGCVRDRLLGRRPDDYDIATSASPEAVQEVFPRAHGVGESFGVMLVHRRSCAIEVATFRKEGPYSDHRRPDHVSAASLEEDAARRDFTINGMYWDPVSETLVDLYGGEADLREGVIRAIGNPADRLQEDHLRMLRAVRFASRFEFVIHHDTESVIKGHRSRLEGISRERIGEEIRRMFLDRNRARAAMLLESLGLAAVVLDESQGHFAFGHLESLPQDLTKEEFGRILAAWALDRGGHEDSLARSRSWQNQMMLSNGDRDAMSEILDIYQCIGLDWSGSPVARQKRLAAREHFQAALSLVAVRDPACMHDVQGRVDELSQTELAPEPLLSGKELIQAGFQAGPRFSKVLEAVYDAQLECLIATKDEAVGMARDLWDQS